MLNVVKLRTIVKIRKIAENASESDSICILRSEIKSAKIQLKVGEVEVKKNHQSSGTDCEFIF